MLPTLQVDAIPAIPVPRLGHSAALKSEEAANRKTGWTCHECSMNNEDIEERYQSCGELRKFTDAKSTLFDSSSAHTDELYHGK